MAEIEWISVKERLPENNTPVLVLATSRWETDGYDMMIAYRNGSEWAEQCIHSMEFTEFYIYANIMYWMPLPGSLKGERDDSN